jgi:hypothetical protein
MRQNAIVSVERKDCLTNQKGEKMIVEIDRKSVSAQSSSSSKTQKMCPPKKTAGQTKTGQSK